MPVTDQRAILNPEWVTAPYREIIWAAEDGFRLLETARESNHFFTSEDVSDIIYDCGKNYGFSN